MGKQPRGYFTINAEEYSSPEFLFTALSMLESRGYPGWTEFMSVIDDPELIIKIIRLFYGLDIKVPPLKEFSKCLQAAVYSYCDMHKNVNDKLPAKGKDIRQFMNITEEEEKELLNIFDEWVKYMHKYGKDIREYLHINRNNTKRRIDLVLAGKKWTARKY